MKKILIIIICLLFFITGCNNVNLNIKDNENFDFQELSNFLKLSNTEGFVLMKGNEILFENYWGVTSTKQQINIFSAGKSVTSIIIGIALEQGLFDINDKVSDYLGNGFSNMELDTENQITIKNLLTMSSGLDDLLMQDYLPNQGWGYCDAWNLLYNILEITTGKDINTYAKEVLFNDLELENTVYKSSKFLLGVIRKGIPKYDNWAPYQVHMTTRDLAKFGKLILNKGVWNTKVLVPESYINLAISDVNENNPIYGYLFWLNLEKGGLRPKINDTLDTLPIPTAPTDLVMALGANDKILMIIPSLDIVIVRLGGSGVLHESDDFYYQNQLWEQVKTAINI